MTEEIAEKKRIVKSIRKGILIRAGTFALTLWIVFTFVFGIRIADGNDMAPAIREGDLVVYYRCGDFANRDSVVYEANGNVYLGRIAGCEGAVIGKTEDHRLTIDGRIQPVQPGLGIYSGTGTVFYPGRLPGGICGQSMLWNGWKGPNSGEGISPVATAQHIERREV